MWDHLLRFHMFYPKKVNNTKQTPCVREYQDDLLAAAAADIFFWCLLSVSSCLQDVINFRLSLKPKKKFSNDFRFLLRRVAPCSVPLKNCDDVHLFFNAISNYNCINLHYFFNWNFVSFDSWFPEDNFSHEQTTSCQDKTKTKTWLPYLIFKYF